MWPVSGLPRARRMFGRLDAMAGAIPHEVEQRVFDLLQDALVDFDLAAVQGELGDFSLGAGELPGLAREVIEHGGKGQHGERAGILQQAIHQACPGRGDPG